MCIGTNGLVWTGRSETLLKMYFVSKVINSLMQKGVSAAINKIERGQVALVAITGTSLRAPDRNGQVTITHLKIGYRHSSLTNRSPNRL